MAKSRRERVERIDPLQKIIRSLGRELFLRYVFWDLAQSETRGGESSADEVSEDYFEFYERYAKDPWDNSRDLINGLSWFRVLKKGYIKSGKSGMLRKLIEPHMRNWQWDMTSFIVRSVLLAGTSEMLTTDVPLRVVLSQYVGLAYKYMEEESAGFVNAVLDKVKKHIQANNG